MCCSTIPPLYGKIYVDLDLELSMENVILLKNFTKNMSSSEVLIFIICSRVIQPLCWSLPGSNKCRIERLCVHVCVYI